jgi:hypothetical protein
VFDSRVIHGRRATCVRASPTQDASIKLVSFNSRTSVFHTDDEGAIPSTRSKETFSRRWLSSDNTCSTSRTRQVRSLRAARHDCRQSIVQRQDHSPRKGEMKVRVLLL